MASFKQIYKYTFSYKRSAILTIFYNLLYVVFNLVSLILFIPFLQLIFNPVKENECGEQIKEAIVKPVYHGGFVDFLYT